MNIKNPILDFFFKLLLVFILSISFYIFLFPFLRNLTIHCQSYTCFPKCTASKPDFIDFCYDCCIKYFNIIIWITTFIIYTVFNFTHAKYLYNQKILKLKNFKHLLILFVTTIIFLIASELIFSSLATQDWSLNTLKICKIIGGYLELISRIGVLLSFLYLIWLGIIYRKFVIANFISPSFINLIPLLLIMYYRNFTPKLLTIFMIIICLFLLPYFTRKITYVTGLAYNDTNLKLSKFLSYLKTSKVLSDKKFITTYSLNFFHTFINFAIVILIIDEELSMLFLAIFIICLYLTFFSKYLAKKYNNILASND